MIIDIILLLLLIYLAILYNSTALIFLAGVGGILLLFLVGILIFQWIRIQYFFDSPYRYYERDDKVSIALKVCNPTLFPVKKITLKIKMNNQITGEKKKRKWKAALDIGENMVILPIEDFSYGVWTVSCSNIRIYDLLGWFYMRKRKYTEQKIIRLPRQYQTNVKRGELEYDTMWESEESNSHGKGNGSAYIREIREYQPGDKQKNIHWKLSAKKEQLLVKEYSQKSGIELLIGLDMQRISEASMELIYSLLNGCVQAGLKLLLVWQSSQSNEISQFSIKNEEELYEGMGNLLEHVPGAWNGEMFNAFIHQLWIKDMTVLLDDMEIEKFSMDKLEEQLRQMEFML